MTHSIKSSRDIILRTRNWAEALRFYETVLGFKVIQRSESIVGFETGSFCLYVEKGGKHGPDFDFLTRNIQATKEPLVAAGCVVVEDDQSVPRCYLKNPL